jgi:putative membrane protein
MNSFTDQTTSGAMRLIAKALGARRLQINTSGSEHVPPRGPALLLARHYHHFFDGLALFAALRRPFHIMVTLDWAQSSLTRRSLTWMTRLARWPVILRRDALCFRGQLKQRSLFTFADIVGYERKALRESVELLACGRLLIIFPEGYPNIDPHHTPKTHNDEMLPFRAGFAAIAAAAEKRCGAKVPLIPVGLRYSAGKRWTVYVNFGAAVHAGDFASREALVRKLEYDVAQLSGLTYPG